MKYKGYTICPEDLHDGVIYVIVDGRDGFLTKHRAGADSIEDLKWMIDYHHPDNEYQGELF